MHNFTLKYKTMHMSHHFFFFSVPVIKKVKCKLFLGRFSLPLSFLFCSVILYYCFLQSCCMWDDIYCENAIEIKFLFYFIIFFNQ